MPSLGGKRRKKGRAPAPKITVPQKKKRRYTTGVGALYTATPVPRRSRLIPNHRRMMAPGQRSMVDREISKLFRPSWVSLLPGTRAYHTPAQVGQLVQAAGLLAKFLDFSRLDLTRLDREEEEVVEGNSDPAWDIVREHIQEMDRESLAELPCGPGGAAGVLTFDQKTARRVKTYSR